MPIAKAICNSSCELIGNSQLQLKVVDRRYMVQDLARNVSRKLLIKLHPCPHTHTAFVAALAVAVVVAVVVLLQTDSMHATSLYVVLLVCSTSRAYYVVRSSTTAN